MFNARQKIARIADGLGLLELSAVLRRNSPRLVILAYHRVLDVGNDSEFASDLELISAGADSFREQLRFIQRHFDVINFRQLEAVRCTKSGLERATAIITFDDGFEDNFKNAFPVLLDLQLPATIFVSTGFLDRGEKFWFEALAQAVMGTQREIVHAGWGGLPAGAPVDIRRAVLKDLLRQMKKMPDIERRKMVEGIIHASGMTDRIARDKVSNPLTWEQAKEMSRAGIEFGSHTVNHPILSRMSEAEIYRELDESKRRIEEVLGIEVTALSYPVGGADAFDARVQRIAAQIGYLSAVSYQAGSNRMAACDWYALRRTHVERYTSMPLFKAEVAVADLLTS